MATIVFVAFAAHVIAWIALPHRKAATLAEVSHGLVGAAIATA